MPLPLCRNCRFCRLHGILFAAAACAFDRRCGQLEREMFRFGTSRPMHSAAMNALAESAFPNEGVGEVFFKDWDSRLKVSPDFIRTKIALWGFGRWPFFDGDPVCRGRRAVPVGKAASEVGTNAYGRSVLVLPLKDVLFCRTGCPAFRAADALPATPFLDGLLRADPLLVRRKLSVAPYSEKCTAGDDEEGEKSRSDGESPAGEEKRSARRELKR